MAFMVRDIRARMPTGARPAFDPRQIGMPVADLGPLTAVNGFPRLRNMLEAMHFRALARPA
jgi:hypothetical protein